MFFIEDASIVTINQKYNHYNVPSHNNRATQRWLFLRNGRILYSAMHISLIIDFIGLLVRYIDNHPGMRLIKHMYCH